MNRILLVFSLVGLAACTAVKESTTTTSSEVIEHTTIVDCMLYDGMTKQATQLTSISSGAQVQVMDTVDVDFVKARVTKDGQMINGYMYRTCFP